MSLCSRSVVNTSDTVIIIYTMTNLRSVGGVVGRLVLTLCPWLIFLYAGQTGCSLQKTCWFSHKGDSPCFQTMPCFPLPGKIVVLSGKRALICNGGVLRTFKVSWLMPDLRWTI